MILGIFFVSLFTYVCSVPFQVPYLQSLGYIEDVTDQLEEHLMSMRGNIPNITDHRRHYSVLVSHIGRIAQHLTLVGAIYKVIYIEDMPENIMFGLMNVEEVITGVEEILGKVDGETEKIRRLIDRICPVPSMPIVCNQIVHQVVMADPARYQEEAKTLLQAGEVAARFIAADLVAVAQEYDEEPYLISHMKELRDMIAGLASLMRNY